MYPTHVGSLLKNRKPNSGSHHEDTQFSTPLRGAKTRRKTPRYFMSESMDPVHEVLANFHCHAVAQFKYFASIFLELLRGFAPLKGVLN
jgi:hypothetical protein